MAMVIICKAIGSDSGPPHHRPNGVGAPLRLLIGAVVNLRAYIPSAGTVKNEIFSGITLFATGLFDSFPSLAWEKAAQQRRPELNSRLKPSGEWRLELVIIMTIILVVEREIRAVATSCRG